MAASYLSVKSKVESLLIDGLGIFLADSTHGEGTHASSALLGQGLTKAFSSYYTLKKNLEDETIDCALMALTKSGQSPRSPFESLCQGKLLQKHPGNPSKPLAELQTY